MMSSPDMDLFHVRLREELQRIGVTIAQAARQIGDVKSQGLVDAVGGRKRITADLLARLASVGVDAQYVVTGTRAEAALAMEALRSATDAADRMDLPPAQKEELQVLAYALDQGDAVLAANELNRIETAALRQAETRYLAESEPSHPHAINEAPRLTENERRLLDAYRAADERGRRAILALAMHQAAEP